MEKLSAQSNAPVIQMEGVAVGSLQDLSATVVEDVRWTVNSGDFWVLAGLQGAGKSDFLMMTGGLMAPLQGDYRLFGEVMPIFEEDRLPERLRLGLVFETGQLFTHLTVRENVALPLRYHRNLTQEDAAAEVQMVLEKLELGPWTDSTPGAIGRSWQKRVGLARALILKPEILLVDDPLAGLDLRHGDWWLGLMKRLSNGAVFAHAQPLTLVVTAADLRPWKDLARQFAILKDRQMTVLGSRAQLEAASDELIGGLLAPEPRDG